MFFIVFRLSAKFFFKFCRKVFGEAVQNTFYVSHGTFRGIFFLKHPMVFLESRTLNETFPAFFWEKFRPNCPDYILRVHRNIFRNSFWDNFFNISGPWAKTYGLLKKNFWPGYQNWPLRVHSTKGRKISFLANFLYFFPLSDSEQNTFEHLSEMFVAIVQALCYVSIGTLYRNFCSN